MKSKLPIRIHLKQGIMSKLILTSATVLFIALTGFGQGGSSVRPLFLPDVPGELEFSVIGNYSRPIKKENLHGARVISDVIDGYPVNWMTSYVSVEIEATCKGKVVKAFSSDEILSPEQKEILNAADQATDIIINVKYTYKDPVTSDVEKNTMHVSLTVVPYAEAKYDGGDVQMKKYLKDNLVNKISESTPRQFQKGILKFTVNSQGNISNARIFLTSGDPKTDRLLLEEIRKMPKWKPAEDKNGEKISQEFKFSIGRNAGC